jgi:hypothetical protein
MSLAHCSHHNHSHHINCCCSCIFQNFLDQAHDRVLSLLQRSPGAWLSVLEAVGSDREFRLPSDPRRCRAAVAHVNAHLLPAAALLTALLAALAQGPHARALLAQPASLAAPTRTLVAYRCRTRTHTQTPLDASLSLQSSCFCCMFVAVMICSDGCSSPEAARRLQIPLSSHIRPGLPFSHLHSLPNLKFIAVCFASLCTGHSSRLTRTCLVLTTLTLRPAPTWAR